MGYNNYRLKNFKFINILKILFIFLGKIID